MIEEIQLFITERVTYIKLIKAERDIKVSNCLVLKSMIKTLKSRSSNFELLRIISMLLIVSSHFLLEFPSDTLKDVPIFSSLFCFLLKAGGKVGVVCFFLISGYFLIDSNFKGKKIILILFQTFFWNMVCFFVFCLFFPKYFTFSYFFANLPLFNYWFIGVYIIILMVFPFVNILLKNISQRQHKIIMLVSFICIILFSTTNIFFDSDNIKNPFLYAIFIYFVGAYIKKYKLNKIFSLKNNIIFFIVSYIILVINNFNYVLLKNKGILLDFLSDGYLYNLFVFLSGLFLFLIFRDIKINQNKFINITASTCLGVYLIHDNFMIHNVILGNKTNLFFLLSQPLFPIYLFLIIISIFSVCSILDIIRQRTIEKWFLSNKILKKIYYFFQHTIQKNIKK